MSKADRHLNTLQNIEATIASIYRTNPVVKDVQIMHALDALTDCYRAETHGHEPNPYTLPEPEQLIFENLKAICESWLGREQQKHRKQKGKSKTVEEIVSCLRKLRKSAERWNKRGGQQGYLNFIAHYV
ncbi:MAG: hypothetical protein V2J55_03140 [Candidatus Competibacteraceae bacterium]|jgi:hypothetical protein|nr:hypothetical protein [Candidatus Competibacteraceae bacterium]